MGQRATILMLALLLAGCTSRLDEVIEEHVEKARACLSRLERILDHCRRQEPLAADVVPDEGQVTGAVFVCPLYRKVGNARTLWLDAHDHPGKWIEPLDRRFLSRDGWWSDTRDVLSDDPPAYRKSEVTDLERHFRELASTRWVLVLKTTEFDTPRHLEETDQYTLGRMKSEAHLYRIEDGERLAAVSFETRGQILGTLGLDFGITSSDPSVNVRSLKARLYGDVPEAAEAHLAARVAGVDTLYELKGEDAYGRPEVERREK